VLDDVAQTHPYLAIPDGRHVINDRYTDPAAFLTRPRSPHADPLEAFPPAIDLANPTASGARRAVVDAARATVLSAGDVGDLVIAVSETVTNATCHGRPPTQLRVWPTRDRIVVTVTDQGSGSLAGSAAPPRLICHSSASRVRPRPVAFASRPARLTWKADSE
jgi:hypothetical protein